MVLGLIVAAGWVGRGLWFFSDDWNIYADYHSGNLLEPFNGHLSLVPAGIYQTLFHTVGVGSYLPYRLCGLVSLGVLGFQVARWSKEMVGPWATVLVLAAIMWNSFGSTNVMFPFLMNFSIPIAALIAIWWHLDRLDSGGSQRGRTPSVGGRHDHPGRHLAAVAVWLTVAMATSGLGVVAAGAVLLELAITRAPWRRWVAVGVPMALWLGWWLGHREANEISTDPAEVLPYAARMLWAGTTSIAAGSKPAGLILGLALVGLVGIVSARGRAFNARTASALGAAVAFAGLTALTRQDTTPPIPPDELRYGWTIGAYVVLATVATVAAWNSTRRSPPAAPRWISAPSAGPVAWVLVVAVLAVGGVRLLGDMADWSDTVAAAAPGLRSNIYAAEAAGADRVPPGTVIRPLSFIPVTAAAYLGAVRDVGSPLEGTSSDQIGGRDDQRRAADELLFASVPFELMVVPVPAAERTCSANASALPGEEVVLQVGPATGADALDEPAVELSRFGAEAALTLTLDGRLGAHTLVIPADASVGTDAVVPYRLSGVGGVTVCTLG